MVPWWEGGEYRGWRAWGREYFHEQCQALEMRPDGEAAERFYMLADRGGVVAITGSPWPCCPRSFLRRDLDGFDAGAHRVVRHALRLYAVPDKVGIAAVTRTPLTPGVVDLLSMIERAKHQQEARRIQQIRDKHGGGS